MKKEKTKNENIGKNHMRNLVKLIEGQDINKRMIVTKNENGTLRHTVMSFPEFLKYYNKIVTLLDPKISAPFMI